VTDPADRIATAAVEGLRRRALLVHGGEVLDVDGLVVSLTNLRDPAINGCVAGREPADPDAALAAAEAAFRARDLPFFSIELEEGRYPGLKAAVTRAGLAVSISHPAMAVRTADLPRSSFPPGVDVEIVLGGDDELAVLRRAALAAFGGDPVVTERFVNREMVAGEGIATFVARMDGVVVGTGTGWLLRETVGVFAIAVDDHARRRGIGAALTIASAGAFDGEADLAWLHPSTMARSMYASLGFREVARWNVWVRP